MPKGQPVMAGEVLQQPASDRRGADFAEAPLRVEALAAHVATLAADVGTHYIGAEFRVELRAERI